MDGSTAALLDENKSTRGVKAALSKAAKRYVFELHGLQECAV